MCNISLGTSGTIFISSKTFGVDSNNALHSFDHADGYYHLMGCMLSAASCNKWWMDEILKSDRPAHLMVLENLQDPGNLGTILRAGEGAGITGLIMSRDTVDIYNPKVIRSTMGSVFRVPFFYTDDLEQTVLDLKARGIRVFAAHLAGKNNYEQEDYTGNTAFLIGNEGNGLTEKLSSMADTWVKIPMAGKVESLNAAIAASILMFETARQRRA